MGATEVRLLLEGMTPAHRQELGTLAKHTFGRMPG